MKSNKLLIVAPAIVGAMVFTACNNKTDTNKVSEAQWHTAITDLFDSTVEKNYHVTRNKDNSDKIDTLDVKGNLLTMITYGDSSTVKTNEIKNKFGYFINGIETNSEGAEINNYVDYFESDYAGIKMNRSQSYNFMGSLPYLFGDYTNFKYDESTHIYKRSNEVTYYPYVSDIQFSDGKIKTFNLKSKEAEKESITNYTFEYGNAKVETGEINHFEIKYDNKTGKFRTDYFEHDKNKSYFFSIDFLKYSFSAFNKIVFEFQDENGNPIENIIRDETSWSPRGWFNTIIFDSHRHIGFEFNSDDKISLNVKNDAFLPINKKNSTFAMWSNSGSPHELSKKVCLVIETSNE